MEAAAESRSPALLFCLAAETKAPTAGDNGTVASIGSNGVNSAGGGGSSDDPCVFNAAGGGDKGSVAPEVAGGGGNGSGVSKGVGAGPEGGDSTGNSSEDGNGSGFISENSLSGCVVTISFAGVLCDLVDLVFFGELEEDFWLFGWPS